MELAQHAIQQAPTTLVQAVVEKTREEITTELVSEVSETTQEERVQVYTKTMSWLIDGTTADFKHIVQVILTQVSELKMCCLDIELILNISEVIRYDGSDSVVRILLLNLSLS